MPPSIHLLLEKSPLRVELAPLELGCHQGGTCDYSQIPPQCCVEVEGIVASAGATTPRLCRMEGCDRQCFVDEVKGEQDFCGFTHAQTYHHIHGLPELRPVLPLCKRDGCQSKVHRNEGGRLETGRHAAPWTVARCQAATSQGTRPTSTAARRVLTRRAMPRPHTRFARGAKTEWPRQMISSVSSSFLCLVHSLPLCDDFSASSHSGLGLGLSCGLTFDLPKGVRPLHPPTAVVRAIKNSCTVKLDIQVYGKLEGNESENGGCV